MRYASRMPKRSTPRPAFVVTSCALALGCASGGAATSSGDDPKQPAGKPLAELTAEDLPIRDAEKRLVYKKSSGECYVQVPKAGEPDPPLLSGERWVEDKIIDCPPAFEDPAVSLADGHYLIHDATTGECISQPSYGNPPPPGNPTPCPAFVKPAKPDAVPPRPPAPT